VKAPSAGEYSVPTFSKFAEMDSPEVASIVPSKRTFHGEFSISLSLFFRNIFFLLIDNFNGTIFAAISLHFALSFLPGYEYDLESIKIGQRIFL